MSRIPLSPVIKRTLSDEAADRLREAIQCGALPPGAQLVERELAQSLGISRVPVREAIHRLVKEGLIKKEAHGGTYVYSPSRKEIEDISALRSILERFVAERVVLHWNAEQEARLRNIVAAMREAASHHDFEGVCEEDSHFHNVLWEIADNPILMEVVSGLRQRISRFLYEATRALPASQLESHVATHDTLIEALSKGDIAYAQEAIAEHIGIARHRILERYSSASASEAPSPDHKGD